MGCTRTGCSATPRWRSRNARRRRGAMADPPGGDARGLARRDLLVLPAAGARPGADRRGLPPRMGRGSVALVPDLAGCLRAGATLGHSWAFQARWNGAHPRAGRVGRALLRGPDGAGVSPAWSAATRHGSAGRAPVALMGRASRPPGAATHRGSAGRAPVATSADGERITDRSALAEALRRQDAIANWRGSHQHGRGRAPARAVGVMVIEKFIRYTGLAVGLRVFEKFIRYTGLAVGLKPSARGCEARLRGLERIISSKTISPRLGDAKPACAG